MNESKGAPVNQLVSYFLIVSQQYVTKNNLVSFPQFVFPAWFDSLIFTQTKNISYLQASYSVSTQSEIIILNRDNYSAEHQHGEG